jgi:hypothetical protein
VAWVEHALREANSHTLLTVAQVEVSLLASQDRAMAFAFGLLPIATVQIHCRFGLLSLRYRTRSPNCEYREHQQCARADRAASHLILPCSTRRGTQHCQEHADGQLEAPARSSTKKHRGESATTASKIIPTAPEPELEAANDNQPVDPCQLPAPTVSQPFREEMVKQKQLPFIHVGTHGARVVAAVYQPLRGEYGH